MAIIKCGTNEEGTLVPLTIEFEPGDVLEVEGAEEAKSIEIQRSSTLEDLSAYLQQLLAWLNADGTSGTVHHHHPNPKLPPPPPEDGAFILKSKNGDRKAIKLTIQPSA